MLPFPVRLSHVLAGAEKLSEVTPWMIKVGYGQNLGFVSNPTI